MSRAAAAARRRVNLPPAYKKQAEALYPDARYSIIEGSTKSGKTAGCMVWQLSQMLLRRPGSVHWWVAPVYGQARIAFRRAANDFADLIANVNQSEMRITLRDEYGGSVWAFRSAENPDNLFGEETESVVVDEASRMREEAWHAVRSTLSTTRGPARVIGNVKGRGNWFYRLARRAEAGERGYHYAMLTAQDAVDGGVLDPEELEQARRDLPPEVYRELYFCEPADGAHNPFGVDAVARAYTPGVTAGEPVVWGLDLARSVDWTVLVGLDEAGRVAAFERLQAPWPDVYRLVERRVGGDPVLVDATGIGAPIVSELQSRGVEATPFIFTAQSKQDLMQSLRIALVDGHIEHAERVLHNELEAFEYRYSSAGRVQYAAPDGMHDDAVMSLALAWRHGQELALVGPAAERGADALIPPAWFTRRDHEPEDGPTQGGLVVTDQAAALVVRRGAEVVHVETWAAQPVDVVAAAASGIADTLGVSLVVYDEAGIGAAVRAAWQGQARIVGANTRLPAPKNVYLPDDPARSLGERFATLGAAAAWELRLRAERGALAVSGDGDDRRLRAELRRVKLGKHTAGRVSIAGSTAGRLAEAAMLSFSEHAVVTGGGLAVWV